MKHLLEYLKNKIHSLLNFRRKISIVLLICSLCAIIILIFYIQDFHRIEKRYVQFGYYTDNCSVENSITITRGEEEDKIRIQYSFYPSENTSSPNIVIYYSPSLNNTEPHSSVNLSNLKYLETGSQMGTENYENRINEYYSIVDLNKPSYLTITLTGDLLLTDAREIILNIGLNKSYGENNITDLSFVGLEGYDFYNINQKPTFQSDYALAFKLDIKDRYDNIKITFHDRNNSYRIDFKLFLIGILLGLCISFFTSILYDFIKQHELKDAA